MRQIAPQTGICFFRAEASTTLHDLLLQADYEPLQIPISSQLIHEWLERGCVYLEGRRQREDLILKAGHVVRLHTRPKSYRRPERLRDAIVLDEEEFLVVDKPSGLPTHPTLDNFHDNAKVMLEAELGRTLYTTHRLDVPTEGLLIVAKTADAQRLFNKMFSKSRVGKVYRSRNQAQVPLGLHTHYMDPESRVPKVVSAQENEAWWKCQLNVDSSIAAGPEFVHQITLLTGKTHQIRAQMSALGAPIVGDITYGAKHALGFDRIILECYRLTFTFRSRTFTVTRPQSIAIP